MMWYFFSIFFFSMFLSHTACISLTCRIFVERRITHLVSLCLNLVNMDLRTPTVSNHGPKKKHFAQIYTLNRCRALVELRILYKAIAL